MSKEIVITQENFNTLLSWLDENRETAGQKYEKIRRRLIQIFVARGCFEADELADETINRIVRKMPQLIDNYEGDPSLYFYGVANNIHLEWLRKQKKIQMLELKETNNYRRREPHSEIEYECLEICLRTLPASQHQLIVEYYMEEKRARIEFRQSLAKKLEITPNALQVKTHRIRLRLLECMENCLVEKNI
jgi:RNA polymerase sigma factor (sigma-70 family)